MRGWLYPPQLFLMQKRFEVCRSMLSASHCPSHTPGTFYHKPIVLSPLKKLHRNRILEGMHLGGNQSMMDEWMDSYRLRGDLPNSFWCISAAKAVIWGCHISHIVSNVVHSYNTAESRECSIGLKLCYACTKWNKSWFLSQKSSQFYQEGRKQRLKEKCKLKRCYLLNVC